MQNKILLEADIPLEISKKDIVAKDLAAPRALRIHSATINTVHHSNRTGDKRRRFCRNAGDSAGWAGNQKLLLLSGAET